MSPTPPSRTRRSRRALLLIATSGFFALFLAGVHPFLAITRPVKADVMIVEGWIPDYALKRAAVEIKNGQYTRVLISGLLFEKGDPRFNYVSDSQRAMQDLVDMGIAPALLEPCPIPPPSFNRTSHMARKVRERMQTLGLKPEGINVVTLGPHARQTLVAYRRMLGAIAPVGVITYPKADYTPARWWLSPAGIKKTTKDFAGWLKEELVGLRS